jgi:hypothetical protein
VTFPPSPPQGEILLYQTEDGRTRIECRFETENLWLTQALMAELFQTTPQNITLHIKALYDEGEVDEAATCKELLQVRLEGNRKVRRAVKHDNLDVILAVGYRVRSPRARRRSSSTASRHRATASRCWTATRSAAARLPGKSASRQIRPHRFAASG